MAKIFEKTRLHCQGTSKKSPKNSSLITVCCTTLIHEIHNQTKMDTRISSESYGSHISVLVNLFTMVTEFLIHEGIKTLDEFGLSVNDATVENIFQ